MDPIDISAMAALVFAILCYLVSVWGVAGMVHSRQAHRRDHDRDE